MKQETTYTYLIADSHYHHDRCCIYSGRPENFTELINENIRKIIFPKDVLIFLGDVIFGNFGQLKTIISSLPGKKILTLGNHDVKRSTSWFYKAGFDFVCDQIVIKNYVLSHFPVKIQEGQINIHGHFHNIPRRNWETYLTERLTDNHYLLSTEMVKYKPILLNNDTLRKEVNLIKSKNFVF